MDINFLRGLATVIVMSAFLGIFWWAYVYRSKESFDQAANSPFADEPDVQPKTNPKNPKTSNPQTISEDNGEHQ